MSGETSSPSAHHGCPPRTDLRQQVDRVGSALADAFEPLLATLASHAKGPRALASELGVTTVAASRLLKGIAQPDAVAIVQRVPGAAPMRELIDAARRNGAPGPLAQRAHAAVNDFEALIRTRAGDRRSLNAMISDWSPESRRELEARSRQSIYKGISELKGISCNLVVAPLIVHPSSDPDSNLLDVISAEIILGLDRLRPDANVQLGMVRPKEVSPSTNSERSTPAQPGAETLDGDPISDGLNSVRLDQFCTARPAPLVAKPIGDGIAYLLGETACGTNSRIDLVLAQMNRSGLIDQTRTKDPSALPPSMAYIPAAPARSLVLDVFVHFDVYADWLPSVAIYDIAYRGPAVAGSAERTFDRMRTSEIVDSLGPRSTRWRCPKFPRYLDLLDHCFEKSGWDSAAFVAHRVQVSYPLHGTQVGIQFDPPAPDREH